MRRQRDAERKAREELERKRREAQQKAQQRKDDINPMTGKPYTPDERRARGKLDEDLRKIEDDPGGLLRAKFYLEYIRRFQSQRGAP